MITHQINLDMVPGGAPEVIHLSQYDNDATLIFSLYASSGLFTVAEGTTVAIRGTKSDGNGISLDAAISGTTVTVDLDQQITAVAGRNIFELTLYKNGKELNTANFIIDVERAAFDKDSIASDSKIREFVDVYDNIDLYLEYAQRAETAADQTTADKNSIREYRDAILADDSATKQAANAAMAAASDATNEVAELKNRLVNAENVNNAQTVTIEGKVDGAYVEDGYLYLTSNNEVVAGPLGPFSGTGGGGGASGGNAATLTVTNSTGWLSKTIANGRECPLSITWSSVEDEMPTGGGTLRITVNGAIKANIAIEQGTIQPDIAPYLGRGSNVVKASVIDVYGNSRTINFSITVVDISISSSFDPSVVYSGPFTFPYTPIGNVAKTVFLEIDGRTIATKDTSVSNSQMSFAIPAQAHGSHKIRCWFTAEINSETVTSNVLYYEVITTALGNDTPIIAIQYGGTSVSQYQTVSIPYSVYDPTGLTAEIELYENARKVNTLTVDRTQQTWAYRSDTPGAVTLAIVCGSTRKELPLTITEADIEVQAETEDLSLYLSSYGRSNAEEHPDTWAYENIECEFDDFNFTSDGWQSDDQGITVLRVGGDARLTIPFKPFATDARATGKTIEIEFATRRVRDYDATILSCMSGGKGITLTAQAATMTSELSSISTQYKEDEHVRLAFVVEKRSENRLVYIYINGIMSGTVQYPDTDNFEQSTPVNITVGSNDCTVDLYCIRVYENDLTRRQVLDNWIADCQDGAMLLDRYARNHVLDEYGQVTVANLPNDLPYMIITAPVLPQYKGDKKTVDITFVDPQYPTKSFTATGVELDVQGTSSAGYARKNYKAKFKKAELIVNGTQKSGYSINGGPAAKVFCYKADVASSEGANNVELVRFYEDLSPYKTPPQLEDSKIRQGIDGFPMVIFQNDGNETTFIGKYNHLYDKGAENVFGFAEGDESWEVLNNNTNLALFKSADMTSPYTDSDGNEHQNWDRSFEGRYPDGNEDITALSRFVAWVNSTDQAAATGDALPEAATYEGMTFTSDTAAYRLAKFKSEIDQYCERRALEFYYLFTEIFLMIDSRAKNAFWTAFMSAGGKWFSLPYDFDTAIGINNEGALAYGYSLEDGDSYRGSYVFNGQPSVLWVNLRQAFAGEIKSMYETLRAGNLSYAEIERRFEEHQSKWPEAIFNEDAYFKYLEPLITDGDAMYLEMLQGSKEQQRKWWLFNRFQYMDSKYQCGDASRATNRITLRAWAKAPITITPYSDIYCTVNWANGTIDSVRGERNHPYVMQCPIDTLNDTEVYIYSASQLASVGDLSGLMLRLANFSYATRLQDIKVGDSDENYDNPHLTDLSFANNTLLQSLDVRNCSGLSTAIDISQCINIEEVYFDGTNIGGLVLPVGGVLRILHLPESITNLTIRKQKKITDLTVAGYDNISTLWIDDCNQEVWDHVPDILDAMASGSRVRLIGMDVDIDTYAEIKALMDTLDTFGGMDEAGGNMPNAMQSISGSIHAVSLTGAQIVELEARYPNVDASADSIQSFVYFYNGETLVDTVEVLTVNGVSGDATYTGATPTKESTAHEDYGFIGWSLGRDDNTVDADALLSVGTDRNVYACFEVTHTKATVNFYNGTTLLRSQTVLDGADTTYGGSAPTRAATAANTFTFSGWSLGVDDNTVDSDALTAVTADRDVYACYTITGRTYTVKFYNGSTLLQTSTGIQYGGNANYTGATPVDPDDSELPFEGWLPEPTNIQGDTDCYAQFDVGEVRFQYALNLFTLNTIQLQTIGARKIDWGDQEQRVVSDGSMLTTVQTTGWTGASNTSGYGSNLKGDNEGVSRWTVSSPGASNIFIKFAQLSSTESSYDYVGIFKTADAPTSISNKNKPTKALFWESGDLSGKMCLVDSDSVTITLYSDSSGQKNGFLATIYKNAETGMFDCITEISNLSSSITSSHKYNAAGQHTIGIYGRIRGVGISQGGGYVTDIPMTLPDSVYDLQYLLDGCININALPTGFFDDITSPITNIKYAFRNLRLSYLDLSPLDLRTSSGRREGCFYGATLQTVKLGPNGNLFDGSDFALTGYEYSGRILRDGIPYTLADAIALNDVAGTWSRGEQISDLEIADTWETIIGYINEGTAAQHYQIGQWKMLSVGTSSFMAQIVAFNADDLADGTGKAKTSWICRTSTIQHRFNPTYEAGAVGTGCLGGWGESELRTYLSETVLPTVQQSVKDAIKGVIKRTKIVDTNGESQNDIETTDSIWIPSERELKGAGETQGVDYVQFHNWAGLTRYLSPSSKGGYWVRTTSNATSQKCVDAQGNVSTLAPTNTSYAFFGFCL